MRNLRDAVRVQIPAKPQKAYDTVCLVALVALLLCTPAFGHRYSFHQNPPKKWVSLFPTQGSLLAQNAAADRMGLSRVRNRAMLNELVGDGSLAPLPLGRCLKSSVAPWRAFLVPWASVQLADIAESFCATFDKPLRVDSAVRPLDVQKWLRRLIGRTAAPVYGPTASVHPTGSAFDLQRRGLTKNQLRWLEWRLFYLQAAGWVIVEEERACFHVVALRDHDGETSLSELAVVAPLIGKSSSLRVQTERAGSGASLLSTNHALLLRMLSLESHQ